MNGEYVPGELNELITLGRQHFNLRFQHFVRHVQVFKMNDRWPMQ